MAWPATELYDKYEGDGTTYVTQYGQDESGYTEVDALCAQYSGEGPYGTAIGCFGLSNNWPNWNGGGPSCSIQNIDSTYIYPPNDPNLGWNKNFTFNTNSNVGGWTVGGGYVYYVESILCSAGSRHADDHATGFLWKAYHLNPGNAPVVTPVAQFTCTPTTQNIDTDVVCTEYSSNTPTDWYWTLDAETWGADAWQTSTSQNFTWQSHYPGFFSVNLRANNSAGSNWLNRTNYVQISNINVQSPYDFTLNATTVNFGQSILGTITSSTDPSLANLNSIAWSYITPTSTPNTVYSYESGSTSNIMNYNLYGATWKGYSTSTNDWTNTKSGLPNPATLTPGEVGTITVHLFVNTKTGENYIIEKTITVGQGTFTTTTFQAYDGSNYNLLQGVEINVKNLNTNTWTNGTYFNGKVSITTPANQILSAYGEKAGYYDAKYENAVADGTPYSLVFYQIGAPPETNNQTFYVNVFTPSGTRVPGALVTVKESGTTTTLTKTTNAAGGATFTLKFSTLYQFSATKSGYIGASTSYTTNTGMSDSISLIMTPTVTATPTPIGSWTVSPYNQTGNLTFWKPWTDLFNQMGASNYEMPLLLAAFILLVLMITGFAMAGVLGGEIALGFGAILCVAIGLIPIWVVLAIIILGFLFYGLKVAK